MNEAVTNGLIFFSIIILIIGFVYWSLERDAKSQIAKNATNLDDTSNNFVKKKVKDSDEIPTFEKHEINKLQSIISKYDFDAWKGKMIKKLDSLYSLSDLLILKDYDKIYYGDLLTGFEWEFKRLTILLRDKFSCQDCMKQGSSNHIHHEYYLQDKLPWDIDDSALITLCYNCHSKRHEQMEIPVYRLTQNSKILVSKKRMYCSRCGGTGYLPHFKHVQNGICFKCWGERINRSAFFKVLEKSFNGLNSYNDTKRRKKYVESINSLSNQELYNKLPIAERLKLKDREDDLPF